ncbi:transglutaminase domain-containing protein [Candidatus Pacearchaeota archaeon]|nr:transglutaminase domain-containing protein [Candidatus Staskawiczbacteria bacterium]MBM3230034.1 transglutaminase domain-containing protein [Candidatus Pacearchaeota archaeon]
MSRIKEVIILVVAFLLLIQSVSAISNVQHSVDGDKVTLSYQGTPPFWINIRGDTNIGQDGGYLWAKTYSNSFSYDMSFAINPSKNFYYAVKDSSWSSANNFVLGEDYCQFPLCDHNPKIYDMTASNNPNNYLGDIIAFESYSDWRNYKPLINKADDLIQGKNNDYDKLVAIANWVKQSKTYGNPTPANEFKTVIDIFNSNTGICLDASILLTAMLRTAGIPARSVDHTLAFHEFNEVFIDGQWIQVDATFGKGGAYIQNVSKSFVDPAYTTKFYLENENVYDQFMRVNYSNIYIYKKELIESEFAKKNGINYGKLIFPIKSKTLFYDNQNVVYSYEQKGFEPVWIMHRIEALDKSCLNKIGIQTFNGMFPSFYRWAVDHAGEHWTGTLRATGYMESKIPVCKYRLHYYYSMTGLNVNGNQLAYADFEIKSNGDVVRINPGSLVKTSEADQNNFNILVNTLKQLPTYESLS